MYKGTRETKGHVATESTPDVITDSDGQVFYRRDYEDERNPGYTKPGKLYSSFELQCCGRWNLTAPSGHRFSAHLPLQSTPDPSIVTRADAPAKLLEAAAKAWAKLEEVRGRIAAALERRTQAEIAHRRAAARGNKAEFNSAIAVEMDAEQQRKAAEQDEAGPCRDAADAEQEIAHWMRLEANTRAAGQQTAPIVF